MHRVSRPPNWQTSGSSRDRKCLLCSKARTGVLDQFSTKDRLMQCIQRDWFALFEWSGSLGKTQPESFLHEKACRVTEKIRQTTQVHIAPRGLRFSQRSICKEAAVSLA